MRDRAVNQYLRQVEHARRAIAAGDADVLMLGDSSCAFHSPDDAERAMIPELISREMGGARVVTVAAGGFGGHVYDEILRFLGTLDARPRAVVVAMAIRANAMTHVIDHPVYRYRRTIETLQTRTDARHRVPWIGWGSQPEPSEYATYEGLGVNTKWTGQTTIGEYRRRLGGGQMKFPLPREMAQLLFDYYHGELLTDDHWGLGAVADFGARVRDYGVPTAAYWTAPPLEYGETLFPGEFTAQVRTNLGKLQAALSSAGDGTPTMLDIDFKSEDFIDPQDGTEHFTLSGRRRIAAAVASALDGRR